MKQEIILQPNYLEKLIIHIEPNDKCDSFFIGV